MNIMHRNWYGDEFAVYRSIFLEVEPDGDIELSNGNCATRRRSLALCFPIPQCVLNRGGADLKGITVGDRQFNCGTVVDLMSEIKFNLIQKGLAALTGCRGLLPHT